MKNWHLIKTKPQQEAIATQNFDVFFPKAVIKNKTTPLFPSYLLSLMIKLKNGRLFALPKEFLTLYALA